MKQIKQVWLRQFTAKLLRHRWYAMLLAFASTLIGVCIARSMAGLPVVLGLIGLSGSIFLTLLGILIAALVTLVNGPIEGAVTTVAATAPYLITLYLPVKGADDPAALNLWIWMGLGVAVASNILTYVFAIMLRHKAGWSLVIQVAALLGVLVISVIHLAYPAVTDWWGLQVHALQIYYEKSAAASNVKMPMPAVAPDTQAEMTEVIKQVVNGMIMMLVLINATFQLAVARWWQSSIYTPGSVGYELRGIRLSRLAGVLFIASLVFSYVGNTVVLDMMPILYVLFGAAGISLVHYIFKQIHSPNTWFWLMVFYLILFFALPFSLVMLAMLALFDIWLNVRRRITKA